jgi:hypothetical protein
MDAEDISRTFSDAEGHGFLPVPLPVAPTLEEAFGYEGRRRFVALAYGVRGGVMGDLVGEAEVPVPSDLYRKFLLHPTIKPHTDAFKIEVEPPEWLIGLSISESQSRMDDLESWMKRSRCLLLDRERRQFFVDTVSEVRGWLMLREALYSGRKKFGRMRKRSPEIVVHELFAWLDEQTPTLPDEQFVAGWEQRFQEKLAMRGCAGAGFELGFTGDEVRSLVREAFQNRGKGDAGQHE